jgi:cohesin complex subunit SA-1/2
MQAFQVFMTVLVLFSPSQTTAADGSPWPTASLAISLDDEVQYRCAGFIQAQIEHFAELLANSTSQDASDNADSDSESDSDGGTPKAKKPKPKKRKGVVGQSGPDASHGKFDSLWIMQLVERSQKSRSRHLCSRRSTCS